MRLKLTSQTGIVKKIVTNDANLAALLARLNSNTRWIDAGENGKVLINTEGIIKIEILSEPQPE
jgi:hypothetical protein